MERLDNFEGKIKEVLALKQEIAIYFCENPEKFKLEDLLQTLAVFCDQLQKAVKVNSVSTTLL